MKKIKDLKDVLVESTLASISEVMSSVASMENEHQTFMKTGCYLYRTSPVIMELKMIEDAPPSTTEVLQDLLTKVNIARELITKFIIGGKSVKDEELDLITRRLEEVLRLIGQVLSSIPLSSFGDNKYVQITVKSLSREMINVCLHTNRMGKCKSDAHKLELSYAEHNEKTQVANPVTSSDKENQVHSSGSGSMPRLGDFLQGMYHGSWGNTSRSFGTSSSQASDYSEPLYDAFFCPLTKRIMHDPVTIESGITFERKAITEWLDEKIEDTSQPLTCPATGIKLQSRVMNSNIALKTTIEEWKRRNEARRIKIAHNALLVASSMSMVLGAMKDLYTLIQKRRYNMEVVHRLGITKLVTSFLEHNEMIVRTEALKLLCLFVGEDEGKVIIASTRAIERATEMLSSNSSLERRASVTFLLELSKSQLLLEKIGSTSGCILMLITMKYNEASDSFAAEKAGIVLKNLEKDPDNIKSMAEYGFLDPLLGHLIADSEDVQVKMARYLSELILQDGMKSYVAGKASKVLMKMLTSEHSTTQGAAFAALVQISAHHLNSKILVDAGIIPILTEELFTFRIHSKTTDFRVAASTILANIVDSNIDLDMILVNKHGHTMTSHYTVYNVAHMLKRCKLSDKLSINLIKILLFMIKLPKILPTVISVVKETELNYSLVDFLNNSREEGLTTASAKLLIQLSSCIGHTITETLCKTQGQPEGLMKNYNIDRITEKHAVSVNLLAKLPHQNLILNLALLHQNLVPILLSRIQEILRIQTLTTSYTRCYLEGLVGILVRFTTTLYDQEILSMARGENLTSVFTDLLFRTTGSNEVQRLAAVGLENLSCQSVYLSRPLEVRTPSKKGFFSKSFTFSLKELKRSQKLKVCPVHRGACSSSTTFCLLESRAVERLLSCLEHENPEVVEAALSAISTLLDEKVDVEKSVRLLSEADAMRHVLGVLRQHREEGVWQKSFWVIERFLMRGGDASVSDLSSDRSLPSTLVTAVHRGSSSTKRSAENILRYLNRTPH